MRGSFVGSAQRRGRVAVAAIALGLATTACGGGGSKGGGPTTSVKPSIGLSIGFVANGAGKAYGIFAANLASVDCNGDPVVAEATGGNSPGVYYYRSKPDIDVGGKFECDLKTVDGRSGGFSATFKDRPPVGDAHCYSTGPDWECKYKPEDIGATFHGAVQVFEIAMDWPT